MYKNYQINNIIIYNIIRKMESNCFRMDTLTYNPNIKGKYIILICIYFNKFR